jgi:four helix bundle protein
MNNKISMENTGNVIRDKSFRFSVRIIKLYQFLCSEKNEYNLNKQILKSGTSIGANVEEAIGGISKKDFSSKISTAYKESRETEYWLKLLFETNYLNNKLFNSLFEDCVELSKILFSILKKTRIQKK